jgi:hypothetical protein
MLWWVIFDLWIWRWHIGNSLCGRTRAGETGGEPNQDDHRQQEPPRARKKGASLDPRAFNISVDTLRLLLSVAVQPPIFRLRWTAK